MPQSVDLRTTECAVCGPMATAQELYGANFDQTAFNPEIFSARRTSDRIHYRLVRCDQCGLVRSDPIADTQLINTLYAQSNLNYGSEVDNIRATYGGYLQRLLDTYRPARGALLEIGCGNGFFLQAAQRLGFAIVKGVEPSRHAVDLADAAIKPHIHCGVMEAGLFDGKPFDVICMFQVLDHIPNPGELIRTCFDRLKPGGYVLCINHNIEAISARLLGERSPIIDIEHTYLYSPKTMTQLFGRYGFTTCQSGSVSNRYSLHYLLRLLPLPDGLRQWLLPVAKRLAADQLVLRLPLGNLYFIAQKPVSAER
jgi:SAM-dependent methyltransferase